MLMERKERSQSPPKKSQFYKQHQESVNSKSVQVDGKSPEYGNPEYVCFKLGTLEFYTKADRFARHSTYFQKMRSNLQE